MTEETIIPSDKILCACGSCRELIPRVDKWGSERKFKPGHQNLGERHWNWKGGKRISHTGYLMVLAKWHPKANKHGYVFLHVLIMEEMLGRRLTNDERVHHINGNKLDNSKSNLKLMSNQAEHMHNHTKQMDDRKCLDCHKSETGKRRWIKIEKEGFLCDNCYNKRKYHSSMARIPFLLSWLLTPA